MPDGQRLSSEAHAADLDFVGLLRRLAAEPAGVPIHKSFRSALPGPETDSVPASSVAGLSVFALPADIIAALREPPSGFAASQREAALPPQLPSYSLFARPPPLSA